MLLKILDKFCAPGGALHQQGEPVGPWHGSVEMSSADGTASALSKAAHTPQVLLQFSASDGSECSVSVFWGVFASAVMSC